MIKSLAMLCGLLCLFLACNKKAQPVPNAKMEPNAHQAGELLELEINGEKWRFRYCPSGSFTMGTSPAEFKAICAWGNRWVPSMADSRHNHEDSKEPQNTVVIPSGFWIAETETTQKQWKSIMGNNPSHFQDETLPVESVTWNDAHAFVNAINKIYADNLQPGYKFALPREVQWEYACRAGTTTAFHYGPVLDRTMANILGSHPFDARNKGIVSGIYYALTSPLTDDPEGVVGFGKKETMPVGSYLPNAWGLFDMHGNVEEYCSDTISGGDPPTHRLRGGGYLSPATYCRSASRYSDDTDRDAWSNATSRGFRLVLTKE